MSTLSGLIVGALAVVIAVLVGGFLTLLVWNYLADPVFASLGWDAFPDINLWTAIGINLLWAIAVPRRVG